jgi:pyruvate/2-oxoglutarate dehydrogenase complex dihydrolipoamide acyltransferase (E2) component
MAHVVVMPRSGQTMEEGSIVEWLKQEGDTVAKGEPLVTIMTDKANQEVESDYDGVLARILVTSDDGDVEVLTPIAIIAAPGEDFDAEDVLSRFESGR